MSASDPPREILPEPYVWRSVNKREWPAAGHYRHILPKKGHHTSLCSTTGLPATVWRAPKGTKPDCPACIKRFNELESKTEKRKK